MACFESSVGVIIRRGDLGLLIQRARGPKAGTWAFPAGHWEPGESAEQTATREVFEEVGLELDTADLGDPILKGMRFADQCRHGAVRHDWIVFEVQVSAGQFAIRDPAEVLCMRWVPIAEWASLDLEPMWRRMLTATGHLGDAP